jgi:hypothetical protein
VYILHVYIINKTLSVFQLDSSDRSGSSQSLRHLPVSGSSNRPHVHNENTANNNQSPNKVTRSQSATSSSGQRRRYPHGAQENDTSMKRSCHSGPRITLLLLAVNVDPVTQAQYTVP